MKTIAEKNDIVGDLTNIINESKHIYITDISCLNSVATGNIRRDCFKKQILLKVTKNTLLKKAFEQSNKNLEELYPLLNGSTSIMLSEIGNEPARLIKEFRRKSDKPIIKGAYVEECVYIGDNQLDALCNIKNKNELIADVVALLQSPIKNVVSALESSKNIISGVVKTLSEKEEK